MNEMWQVTEVTEKPGIVLATLQPVEWFKKNPEWEKHADDVPAPDEEIDEFIDAQPDEEGAERIEVGPTITVDITDGPDLHPLDNVRLTVQVFARVDV